MIQDDKAGIGFGRLDPMGQYGSFDGKTFHFDEKAGKTECDAVANAGGNYIHTMTHGVWNAHPGGRKSQFQPFVLDTKTKRWSLRANGKNNYNDYFFPTMKKIFKQHQDANLSTIFDLFNGCELRGIESAWSPWVVNNEGIHSFYEPAADEIIRDFFKDCISEFRGFDIIWSANETENRAYPGMFERVILPTARAKKIPWNRLSYGATTKMLTTDSNQDLVRQIVRNKYGKAAEKSILMPDHGFPFTKSLAFWGEMDWTAEYSDDGYYGNGAGDSKCDVRPGKGARPSAKTWGKISLVILQTHPIAAVGRAPLIFICHLPAGFSTGDLACWLAPIEAIAASYRARFDRWPANYGKHS